MSILRQLLKQAIVSLIALGASWMHKKHKQHRWQMVSERLEAGDIKGAEEIVEKSIFCNRDAMRAELKHEIALIEHDKAVKADILFKSNPANVNDKGDTPLMTACRKNDNKEARNQLAKGANVHCKNKAGETALMLAASHFDADPLILTVLLNFGASREDRDRNNRNVVMHAMANGAFYGATQLMRHGAKVDFNDAAAIDTAMEHAEEFKKDLQHAPLLRRYYDFMEALDQKRLEYDNERVAQNAKVGKDVAIPKRLTIRRP